MENCERLDGIWYENSSPPTNQYNNNDNNIILTTTMMIFLYARISIGWGIKFFISDLPSKHMLPLALRGIFFKLSIFFYYFDHNRLHNFTFNFFIIYSFTTNAKTTHFKNKTLIECSQSRGSFLTIFFSTNLIDWVTVLYEKRKKKTIFNCNRASHFTSLFKLLSTHLCHH